MNDRAKRVLEIHDIKVLSPLDSSRIICHKSRPGENQNLHLYIFRCSIAVGGLRAIRVQNSVFGICVKVIEEIMRKIQTQ